ncbi:Heat shock protein 15 [compost metagenome]
MYVETPASIVKRENAAAQRKAGALGVSTDGKPSKKQRRDLFKFHGGNAAE